MPADLLSAELPPHVPDSGGGEPATPSRVAVGGRWRDSHEVLAARESDEARWFKARNLATQTEEWLLVSSVATTAPRDPVWQKLHALDCPQVQRTTLCHVGDERVEVWADVGSETLRTWRARRPVPSEAEVRALVRDLLAALEALHGAGVGFFGLTPDHVMVIDSAGGEPSFCLADFMVAELFEQSDLIAIPVDAHYAPPEAAGLFQHRPGPLLTAWDYWSLGRVVQEFILGHAVLDLLPSDVRARLPLSLAGQAESLLAERETGTLRAGAVELMPVRSQAERRLLRGLLTGAAEGRWGAGELREWLAGSEPPEHYDAPRHRHFFRIDGRGHTVASAAKVLSGPARHGDVVAQAFAAEQPGTLAHFLQEAPGYHAENEQLQACRKLTDLPALKPFTAGLRQEIAATLGLHALSQGTLHWRGEALNEESLRARLVQPEHFVRLSTELRALSLPLVLGLVGKHDAATAQMLEQLRQNVDEAEALIARHGWHADRPQAVWLAALEPRARFKETLAAMHRQYACSSVKALDAIFQAAHPTEGMQVVLLWAGGAAARYGFLTHEQVKQTRLAALEREGEALVRALFWHRLARALRAVPLIFGTHWILAVGSVAVFAMLAVHVPGPWGVALGFCPLVVLVGLRIALNRWHRQLVAQWGGKIAAWGWRDGPARCQRELRAAVERESVPGLEAGVRTALSGVEQQRRELLRPEPAPPLARPPRHWVTWGGALLGWLLLLGIVAGSVRRTMVQPPSLAAHVETWRAQMASDKRNDEPPDPRISWPYRTPDRADIKLSTAEPFKATPDQEDYALQRGRRLTANYRPPTIKHLVAVYVPVDDRQGGLLLYDGASGKIVRNTGVMINFLPMSRSWLSLEDEFVLFIEK